MKRTIFILTAFFAMASVSNLSAQTVNDVNAKYNEAVELVNNNRFGEAIPVLEEVISMGLEVGGDAAETVTLAQKALPGSNFQYGLALSRDRKLDEAIPVLKTAIEQSELYSDTRTLNNSRTLIAQVYTLKGGTAFNSKKYNEAIEIFKEGYEINPNDTKLALVLAESYSEVGNYTEGMKIFDHVISLGNRHSRYQDAANTAKDKKSYYYTVQAKAMADKDQITQAYALLENVLKDDPGNANTHLIRIQIANNAKRYNDVIRWAPTALQTQKQADNRSDIYFLLGSAYENTEKPAQAIENYKKVTSGPYAPRAKALVEEITKTLK